MQLHLFVWPYAMFRSGLTAQTSAMCCFLLGVERVCVCVDGKVSVFVLHFQGSQGFVQEATAGFVSIARARQWEAVGGRKVR